MASQLDQIIKAERFTTLKNQVKEECKRRKYIGSVAAYGLSEWDYSDTATTTIPAKDKEIQKDHYNKISIPLKKINWMKMPNGPLNREINDKDLLVLETMYAALHSRSITNRTTSDCAASCTGTCTTYCDTGCSDDCTGSCGGSSCSGGCSGSCKGSCSGKCSVKCVGYTCQAECSQCTCGNGCQGACTVACSTSSFCDAHTQCANLCQQSCTKSCESGCSTGCYGKCAAVCATGCGNSCTPCDCTPYTSYEN